MLPEDAMTTASRLIDVDLSSAACPISGIKRLGALTLQLRLDASPARSTHPTRHLCVSAPQPCAAASD